MAPPSRSWPRRTVNAVMAFSNTTAGMTSRKPSRNCMTERYAQVEEHTTISSQHGCALWRIAGFVVESVEIVTGGEVAVTGGVAAAVGVTAVFVDVLAVPVGVAAAAAAVAAERAAVE